MNEDKGSVVTFQYVAPSSSKKVDSQQKNETVSKRDIQATDSQTSQLKSAKHSMELSSKFNNVSSISVQHLERNKTDSLSTSVSNLPPVLEKTASKSEGNVNALSWSTSNKFEVSKVVKTKSSAFSESSKTSLPRRELHSFSESLSNDDDPHFRPAVEEKPISSTVKNNYLLDVKNKTFSEIKYTKSLLPKNNNSCLATAFNHKKMPAVAPSAVAVPVSVCAGTETGSEFSKSITYRRSQPSKLSKESACDTAARILQLEMIKSTDKKTVDRGDSCLIEHTQNTYTNNAQQTRSEKTRTSSFPSTRSLLSVASDSKLSSMVGC